MVLVELNFVPPQKGHNRYDVPVHFEVYRNLWLTFTFALLVSVSIILYISMLIHLLPNITHMTSCSNPDFFALIGPSTLSLPLSLSLSHSLSLSISLSAAFMWCTVLKIIVPGLFSFSSRKFVDKT